MSRLLLACVLRSVCCLLLLLLPGHSASTSYELAVPPGVSMYSATAPREKSITAVEPPLGAAAGGPAGESSVYRVPRSGAGPSQLTSAWQWIRAWIQGSSAGAVNLGEGGKYEKRGGDFVGPSPMLSTHCQSVVLMLWSYNVHHPNPTLYKEVLLISKRSWCLVKLPSKSSSANPPPLWRLGVPTVSPGQRLS